MVNVFGYYARNDLIVPIRYGTAVLTEIHLPKHVF